MSRPASRSTDNLVLDWIRQRARGRTTVQIAADYGVTDLRVRNATNRVLKADIEESGEPGVARAYWGQA